jgi:hypothetical protein
MRIITRRAVLAVTATALTACSADTHDETAIGALMRAMFDRPDAPLDASPIVVSGHFAIADWTQGEMGGRALLQREGSAWRLILCAGDGLRTETGLAGLGVPPADAQALARDLAAAERETSATRLAAMARFEGVVRMER